jgi:hypothetical protein
VAVVEAAADPDLDSAGADRAEGREAVRAQVGAAARVAAEVCGKQGKPQAAVAAEVLAVPAAVEVERAPAAGVARVREQVEAADLAVLVEAREAPAAVVEAARVREPVGAADLAVQVEDLEVPAAVEEDLGVPVADLGVQAVVEAVRVREPAAAEDSAVGLELVGREVVGPVEEAEDRVEAAG